MNEVQIFNFKENSVRTQYASDEVWFCLKDVCDILDIRNQNNVVTRLNQKGIHTMETPTNGGIQKLNFINESNLYKVIFQSRKPQAEEFTEWVTGEVLPTIRKTGGYQMPKDPMQVLKLMFDAQEQTNDKLNEVVKDVQDLKDNKSLTPGEYNYLSKKVRDRVRDIKVVKHLEKLNQKQNSKLYQAINHDLNAYLGYRTRSQIRAKDFDKALDFIAGWEPSYTDMKLIDQLKLDI